MIRVELSVWSRILFGIRVMQLLETYEDVAGFYSPDVCFAEAEKYIPDVAKHRGLNSALARSILQDVTGIIQPVDKSLYESHEKLARERIQRRDPRDWPVVAVALMLGLPARKIRTFSEAAFQPGQQIVSNYISEAPRRAVSCRCHTNGDEWRLMVVKTENRR